MVQRRLGNSDAREVGGMGDSIGSCFPGYLSSLAYAKYIAVKQFIWFIGVAYEIYLFTSSSSS